MSKRRFGLDISPLKIRDFRLLFIASLTANFGSIFTYVAVPYQVKVLTGDTLKVGLLGLFELVPMLIMSFVGGALADYVDRRRLIILSRLGFTVLTGILVLNSMADQPKLWVLYAVVALMAAVDGVHRPAFEALLPRLAPPEMMPAVSALGSLRYQVAHVGGPVLVGLMLAQVDLGWVYSMDVAFALVALSVLVMVRAVPPPEAAERPSLRTVVEGIRYAKSRPELIGTYLIDINAMFFAFPLALYPFMADRYGGPAVLGVLYTAPALGSLLVTLTSAWTGRIHRHGLAVCLAAAAWGGGIVIFGLAHSLWLAVLGLMIAGGCDMISGIFRGTIWNQTIPDHLRGRLAGIEMLSYLLGPMLGQTRAGMSARWWGPAGAVVWGGVLCAVGTAALAKALPSFVRYDGRNGLAHKQAEESARAAQLAEATA